MIYYQGMKQPTPIAMSPHRQEACNTLSPTGRKFFQYIEFDDDEKLLVEIRKHPIGLVAILVTAFIVVLVMMVLTFALSANIDQLTTTNASSMQNIILGVGFLISIFTILGTYIPVFIYRASVIFITNEKIAEVEYISLFNRKITQLGVGNIENVTYAQKGILPRLFDYGTLIVETAAETENCNFSYVPRPNGNTQLIIEAHEAYVQKYGN